MKVKRALISVSNKEGITVFVKGQLPDSLPEGVPEGLYILLIQNGKIPIVEKIVVE